VEEARALSTPEALNLIFLPGFTTAPSVTRAAGRGIGLDVVRTNVNRLNGEIEVDTEPGVRTRFTFTLPLTVAIADALLVRAGSEVLAIPLTTVGIMRFVDPAGIHAMGEREMVELDGQPMELIRLGRVLGLGEPAEEGGRVAVVVLRAGGLPFAVAVDELLGKQEIVIKPLGDFLDGAGPFAGATISGEGRVILLIDPTQLFELSRGAAGRRADEPVAAPAAPSEGPRAVLLVDDSVSVRRFVGQMLERAGFRVTTAVDGQDALEQLAEQAVDCVITDLEMPRVNGYALIEDLRRRTGTRHLPVVVLTTRTGDKHAGLARRLGVRHYVGKPVEEHAFVRLIESVAAGEAELCGTGSA
jgi:chemosensory pili system protein ChpA (sensor histidine kinase/response regulator)